MSGTDTCDLLPISDGELEIWKVGFYQTAAGFVLWGLQISLACQAVYVLWNRGFHKSRERQAMAAMVAIMLGSSTAQVIVGLELYLIQLPYVGIENSPAVEHQLVLFELARTWLIRLNYCINDIIVVWRAWALWPHHALVQWTLIGFMGITIVCTTVNAGLSTAENLRFVPEDGYMGPMYPPSALRAMLYIPLLATNVLATVLIGYKAWLYRKDVRAFASASDRDSSSRSSLRLDRVFALFIETGALYVIFFTLNMLCTFGIFERLDAGYALGGMWSVILNLITGIYPTVIIILVATFMSQSDVVISTLHESTKDSSQPRGSPVHKYSDERRAPTHTLSTIRFDMPRMATAITVEEEEERRASQELSMRNVRKPVDRDSV